MEKLESNALFFSNKNIELAYTIKKICRSIGVNVINCESSTKLIMSHVQIQPQIIIFDLTQETSCNTEFIKNFCIKGFYFVPNVIIISNNKVDIDFEFDNTVLSFENQYIEKQFIECINQIRLSTIKYKAQKYPEQLISEAIVECLKPLCFNKSFLGYKYLKDIVKMLLSNNGVTLSLTTVVYPAVAAINNCSVFSVERNIRSAVQHMWKYSKQENIYNFFGEIKIRRYPSNRQIISILTEKSLNYCMLKYNSNNI